MDGQSNDKLRAAREAAPSRLLSGLSMSRSELAEHVNAHVWRHHRVRAPVDRKYLAKLEAGKVRWPNARYRQALRDILGAGSDADLGFVPAQLAQAATPLGGATTEPTELQLPWTLVGALDAIAAVTEVDPMDRRAFIQLSGLALSDLAFNWLVALPAATAERITGQLVGHAQVDALDAVGDELRRMDDRLGGGAVVALARGQLQAVARLLRDGRYTDSVGRRLHASAAELLRLCGWLSWDTADHAGAHRYWQASLHAAHVAGDNQIGANVMAFWACQALEAGRPADALSLSGAARLRLSGSPKVAAIVHLCHAEAAGAAQEDTECRRSIDAAFDSLDTPVDEQPSWAYWVDQNFAEMAGYALLQLGDLDAAITHLSAFVAATAPGREQARGQVFLARAYAERREPEQAAAVGVQAIDLLGGDVVSPRTHQQLHSVSAALAPYRIDEVDEFNERLSNLA